VIRTENSSDGRKSLSLRQAKKANKQSNGRLRPEEKANQAQGGVPKLSVVINPNLEPAA